jgi:hypothetical protein
VHELFPRALIVRVLCPGVTGLPELAQSAGGADHVASSLMQAIQICESWQEAREQRPLPAPRTASNELLQAGTKFGDGS